jgi:hypothetical protein
MILESKETAQVGKVLLLGSELSVAVEIFLAGEYRLAGDTLQLALLSRALTYGMFDTQSKSSRWRLAKEMRCSKWFRISALTTLSH